MIRLLSSRHSRTRHLGTSVYDRAFTISMFEIAPLEYKTYVNEHLRKEVCEKTFKITIFENKRLCEGF